MAKNIYLPTFKKKKKKLKSCFNSNLQQSLAGLKVDLYKTLKWLSG